MKRFAFVRWHPFPLRHFRPFSFRLFFLLFFLASFSPASSALAEYNYLLEPPSFPFASSALYGRTCSAPFTLSFSPPPLHKAAAFQESLSHYRQMQRHLSAAKLLATSEVLLFSSNPLASRLAASFCHQHLFDAVHSASRASQSALRSTDQALAEFNRVQDESDDFAQGVRNEVQETQENLKGGRTAGSSLGARILRASQALQGLSSFPQNPNDFRVLSLLVSNDSVLSESFLLHEHVEEAILLMHQEQRRLADELQLQFAEEKRARKRLEEAGLLEVDEDALQLQHRDFLDSRSLQPLFSKRAQQIREEVKDAELLAEQARSLLSKKEAGYLGRALKKERQVLASLERVLSEYDAMDVEADALKTMLEQEVLTAYEKIDEKIQSRSESPLAYALLVKLREEYVTFSDSYFSLKTIGKKTNHLLHQRKKLSFLEAAADSAEPYVFALQDAALSLNEVRLLLQKAKEDGIPVESETLQANAFSSALGSLQAPSENTVASLLQLRQDADALRQSVLSKTRTQYLFLEGQLAFLLPFAYAFSPAEQTAFQDHLRFFPNGKLDVEAALGHLSALQSFFQKTRASLESRAPVLLQQHLAQTLRLEYQMAATPVGQPATVFVFAALENRLPLAYEGFVQVPLPISSPPLALLHSSPTLLASSPGLSLAFSEGKPVLLFPRVEQKAYEATLQYEATSTHLISQEESTVYAHEQEARKELRLRFRADQAVPVLVEKRTGFDAEFFAETLSPYSILSSSPRLFRLQLNASLGENEVRLSYSWKDPFHTEQQTLSSAPSSLDVLYTFRNENEDLQDVFLHLRDLPCLPSSLSLESLSEDFSVRKEGNASLLFASSWGKGQEKQARVRFQCPEPLREQAQRELDALQQLSPALSNASLFQAQFFRIQSLLDAGQEPEALQALNELKQTLSSGAFSSALSLPVPFPDSPIPTPFPAFPAPTSSPPPSPAPISLDDPELLEFKDRAETLLQLFVTSFASPPGLEARARRLSLYKEAAAAASTIKETLSALEKADGKTTAWLQAKKEKLSQAVKTLDGVLQSLEDAASEKLEIARARQAQFGDAGNLAQLVEAETAAQNGHAATAFLLASDLSESLSPKASDSAFPSSWLLLVPALLLAGALFFLLWKRKEGENE